MFAIWVFCEFGFLIYLFRYFLNVFDKLGYLSEYQYKRYCKSKVLIFQINLIVWPVIICLQYFWKLLTLSI